MCHQTNTEASLQVHGSFLIHNIMNTRVLSISPAFNAFQRSVEIEMARCQAEPLSTILAKDVLDIIVEYISPIENEDSGKDMCGVARCVRARWASLRARDIFRQCMSASLVGALSHSIWMVEDINEGPNVDGVVFKYKELSFEAIQILEDSENSENGPGNGLRVDDWLCILESHLGELGLSVERIEQRELIFDDPRPWKKDIEGLGRNHKLLVHWGDFDLDGSQL